jgi:trehalose/maltose hydrolase-like predicted phosphorylase
MVGGAAMIDANKRSKIDANSLLLQHQAAIIEGIADSKSKYRKIVQAGIAKWVSDFQKCNIQVNSVDDLKKLIELDIDLQRDEL